MSQIVLTGSFTIPCTKALDTGPSERFGQKISYAAGSIARHENKNSLSRMHKGVHAVVKEINGKFQVIRGEIDSSRRFIFEQGL